MSQRPPQGPASRYPGHIRAPSAMSTIESTVTRLLVATKQLLESLTHWARGDASEQDVSDVYVNLGNEFNIACRAFLSAGIEVADLGDVPQALRVILEKALSEDASQENLDRYLPSIREIVVNLLKQLKQKQTVIRSINQRQQYQGQQQHSQSQPLPYNSAGSTAGSSTGSYGGLPQISHQHTGSTSSGYSSRQPPVPTHGQQGSVSSTSSSGSHERKYPTRSESLTSLSAKPPPPSDAAASPYPHQFSQSQPLPQQRLPIPPSQSSTSVSGPISRKETHASNPLAALQRSEALERRASRRFSAFQFAKLTNGASGDLPPLPTPDIQNSLLPTTGSHSSTLPDYTLSTSVVGYGSNNGLKGADLNAAANSPAGITVGLEELSQNNEIAGSAKSLNNNDNRNNANINDKVQLFLQLGSRTKKVMMARGDLTLAGLRLKFVESFAYTPGSEVFPDMNLQDPKTGIRYELDEGAMSDLRAGNVLVCLNVEGLASGVESVLPSNEKEENIRDEDRAEERLIILDRMEKMTEMLHQLDKKVEQYKFGERGTVIANGKEGSQKEGGLTAKTEDGPIIGDELRASVGTKGQNEALSDEVAKSEEENSTRRPSSGKGALNTALRQLDMLRREIAAIRQISSTSIAGFKSQIIELQDKIQMMKNSAISQSASSSRAFMESCHKKLSQDSDQLLTNVDELQDVIEALRKDVAHRGVRQSSRQLEAVAKELASAHENLDKMAKYIEKERGGWKKIWERELDTICEEQQFMKLQEELVADLRDDLKKAQETFDLVEMCSQEQSKASGMKRPVASNILPVPADGSGIFHVKDAVMSEVSALQPNHEQRVEAIERAEKLRKRELEIRLGGQFEEELEEFVSENKLKKSGGVEETERQRKLREQKVLEEQAKTEQALREQKDLEKKKKKKSEGKEASSNGKEKKTKTKKKSGRSLDTTEPIAASSTEDNPADNPDESDAKTETSTDRTREGSAESSGGDLDKKADGFETAQEDDEGDEEFL